MHRDKDSYFLATELGYVLLDQEVQMSPQVDSLRSCYIVKVVTTNFNTKLLLEHLFYVKTQLTHNVSSIGKSATESNLHLVVGQGVGFFV